MLVRTLRYILTTSKTEIRFQKAFSSTAETQSTELPEYDTRLLKVAIIGIPNAGKSTFINNLMDRKVCATSSKVHTTRGKSKAIFTADDAQIVFIDTPGLVSYREQKKYNLEKSFIKDSQNILYQADIVGVIHDVTNVWTRERLDIKIIKLLQTNSKVPSFLVLNKIDALRSKRKLLDLTRQLTENCLDGNPIPGSSSYKKDESSMGWPNFKEIFMVSSLTGNGLSEVKNYLIRQAKPGKWLFPEKVWTDQSAESIICRTVQAKLLDFLPQEIPYQLKPEIEYFDVDEKGVISTAITVACPSERIMKLVAGASEGKLRQITQSLQEDLQETFRNYVRLNLALRTIKRD